MALAVCACAKAPENIAAVPIETQSFAGMSCSQLNQKNIEQQQLLKALSSQQKQTQAGDAWGVFLLGLPVSSMSGSDKETEIAVTKGRIDAIERRKGQKGCT
ncbi:MAG: hypothetical protein AAFN80_16795 [Pseudomonadota bacterium]